MRTSPRWRAHCRLSPPSARPGSGRTPGDDAARRPRSGSPRSTTRGRSSSAVLASARSNRAPRRRGGGCPAARRAHRAGQGQHRNARVADDRGQPRAGGNVTGRDAPLIARLRAAGGVVLGKTNLSEWANIRSSQFDQRVERGRRADPQPSRDRPQRLRLLLRQRRGGGRGAGVGGHRDRDRWLDHLPGQRSTASSGSSRRSALSAARFVVPISHSQDTAGPMARTVADAALLLNAIAGPRRG